jgi:hypothetical protein
MPVTIKLENLQKKKTNNRHNYKMGNIMYEGSQFF